MITAQAWDYALGMIKVDGLEPSEEMMEMIEKSKKGQITAEEILKRLDEKYSALWKAQIIVYIDPYIDKNSGILKNKKA